MQLVHDSIADPIIKLPPDLQIGDEVQSLANLWHLQDGVWKPIWAKTDGGGPNPVKLAVLDTGMNDHPDLPAPIAAKSFINGQSWRDPSSGHGTHCAGTALGRNGIGVAPGCQLIVGKVLSNGGSGSSSGIAAGIRWATEQGADVISMSLGGGSAYEPTRQAIAYALSRGTVVVAAAGNAGYNGRNTIGYPGRFLESLCIGATQQNGQIANFSSGGRQIDIAAPGQSIISASNRGGYRSMSGTSMATPFAAGLCALIIESMRREGHAMLTGVEAWREFFGRFVEDRGAPGTDVRFGQGVPKYTEIVDYLAALDVEFS